jgi:hypothetical protein
VNPGLYIVFTFDPTFPKAKVRMQKDAVLGIDISPQSTSGILKDHQPIGQRKHCFQLPITNPTLGVSFLPVKVPYWS